MKPDKPFVPAEFAGRVLGSAAASHIPLIDQMVCDLPPVCYRYMESEDLASLSKRDSAAAMRVYWIEILYRAHFSAFASLIRTKRWLDGLLAMAHMSNYLGFMACFRGFLESSADSFYSLGKVSIWLADYHMAIKQAVQGQLGKIYAFIELENALIHFVHARRLEKEEKAPDEHRAKEIKEYIESLGKTKDKRVPHCYRILCNATHPAQGSLLCYVKPTLPSSAPGFGVTNCQDADWIRSFGKEFQDVSSRLMFFGAVPPLMILRLINEFDVPSLNTKAAMNISTEGYPMWAEIDAHLADQRFPEERGY